MTAAAFSWTAAAVDHLRARWGVAGVSAAVIAGELGPGCSRNGVISKAHRLGLPKQPPAPGVPVIKASAPRKTLPPAAPAPIAVAAPPVQRPEPQPVPPGGVRLTDLREHHCRFPLWPDHQRSGRYCGAPIATGLIVDLPHVYCAHHRTIAYVPNRPRLR